MAKGELPLVPVSEAQAAFLSSDKPFVGFVGGVGSGKSWVLCYDLLARCKSGCLYMVVGPTYPSLRDSTLRSFRDVCAQVGAKIGFNESNMIARFAGAEFLFRSADDPERMRGPNLTGVALDEASLMHEDAFRIAIGRLRQGGTMGWLRAAFTPKGTKHWTFKVFGRQSPDTDIVHARTTDNPFLDEAFETTVRRQYTSQFARRELGGEFVDLGGNMVQREWFRVVPVLPPDAVARVRYWDTAGTAKDENPNACYTAGVLMEKYADGTFGVADVVRGQWAAGTRDRIIRETAEVDQAVHGFVTTFREQGPGDAGKDVIRAYVSMMAGFAARGDRVTGDKVERFQPFAAQVEAGNVLVRAARWTDDYLDELCAFPEGGYADQADASSGGFNRLAQVGGGTMAVPTGRAVPAREREACAGGVAVPRGGLQVAVPRGR